METDLRLSMNRPSISMVNLSEMQHLRCCSGIEGSSEILNQNDNLNGLQEN